MIPPRERRLLVTRALSVDPRAFAAARDPSCAVDLWEHDEPMPRLLLFDRVREARALVCMPSDRIDAALLDAAPHLACVACHSAGHDHVDLDACAARGVRVTHTPDALTDATADLALALLLALARRLGEGERVVRAALPWSWAPRMLLGLELRGAVLGLVGFGRIAQGVAARARAFGMEVLACGRRPLDPEALARTGAREAPFEELLANSDVLSLHAPLTPATHHLLDAAALARMKRGALLVNTARGPVVDEGALADALEAGHLGGAGLDVHEREPAVHPRLLHREDVVLLPHLGSATRAARQRMAEGALEEALRALRGEPALFPLVPGDRR